MMAAGLISTHRPTRHNPARTRTENCGRTPGSKSVTHSSRPPAARIPSRLRPVLSSLLALRATTIMSATAVDNATNNQNGPGDRSNIAHNDEPMEVEAAFACPGWLATLAVNARPPRRLVRPSEVASAGPKQKTTAPAQPATKLHTSRRPMTEA